MRKILGTLHSTPIHSMQAETRLPPLQYAAVREADKLIISLLQVEHHYALQVIRGLAEKHVHPSRYFKVHLLVQAFWEWTDSGLTIKGT